MGDDWPAFFQPAHSRAAPCGHHDALSRTGKHDRGGESHVRLPGKIGLACAIAFVLFLLIGAFTLLLFATSKSWIFYEGGDDK